MSVYSSDLLNGVYCTNPEALPSEGIPTSLGFSEYGTIMFIKGGDYVGIIYIDVFGNMCTYNNNQGGWKSPYN